MPQKFCALQRHWEYARGKKTRKLVFCGASCPASVYLLGGLTASWIFVRLWDPLEKEQNFFFSTAENLIRHTCGAIQNEASVLSLAVHISEVNLHLHLNPG